MQTTQLNDMHVFHGLDKMLISICGLCACDVNISLPMTSQGQLCEPVGSLQVAGLPVVVGGGELL